MRLARFSRDTRIVRVTSNHSQMIAFGAYEAPQRIDDSDPREALG
jgi:hypothetical protein